jgi:hypothetical protein
VPDPAKTPDPAGDRDRPLGQQPYIPKPPTREDLERISQEQALITDEWTGEGPEARPPDRPPPSRP